jgi:hypothetical protein
MKLPKHHYIPVFYLKQWIGTDRRLIAFRRPYGDTVVASSTTPKHTGYVRGLYWLEGSDPEIANRIETIVMGHIDHNAAIAHQFILRDDITSLPKAVRLAWCRFIVGLLLRSPATLRRIYNQMFTPGTTQWKQLSRQFKLDFPGQRYDEIPLVEKKRGALFTLARLTQNPDVEKTINEMRWSVYDLGLPELRFFTSDRPVIMNNGISKKDGHVAIPISPRKLFLAFANEKIQADIQSLSPWHIADQVNAVVVRSAIDVAWDTTAFRLPFVMKNLSTDAGGDRNFFGD